MLGKGAVMWRLSFGLLVLVAACKSSGAEPVDPLAERYCADCCQSLHDGGVVPCVSDSEVNGCIRVVNDTLKAACPSETHEYYECVTANDCDTTACASEWALREACMAPPDAGAGGAGGDGGAGGAGRGGAGGGGGD